MVMIDTHKGGQQSKWHFPETNRCPILPCNQKFPTRFIAKTHFLREHAPMAVLCDDCKTPVQKQNYRAHRLERHDSAEDTSVNISDDSSDDTSNSTSNGTSNDTRNNRNDTRNNTNMDNSDDSDVELVVPTDPSPPAKKQKRPNLTIIDEKVGSWRALEKVCIQSAEFAFSECLKIGQITDILQIREYTKSHESEYLRRESFSYIYRRPLRKLVSLIHL